MSELEAVAAHYERLLAEHGETARGVDYRDTASQEIRFDRLDPLVLDSTSVCDLGCGYGAYLDHLRALAYDGAYVGVDIAPAMVEQARARHPGARFEVGAAPVAADAVVASGTFNVRFGPHDAWVELVRRTIGEMWDAAELGIGLNALSAAVSPHVFAVDPDVLGGWIADLGPRETSIQHDVGTRTITVIARK